MQILLRITKMAWRYRARLVLAYISFFAAIGFALLVPRLFGTSVDRLVRFDPVDGCVIPLQVDTSTLVFMALTLLGAGVMRGVADFARTYTTDSLSQKVSYDLRNLLYDKLQHLSFAFHDSEHTGNLMSKATADIEQVRRFVNLGLVRSLDVVIRLIAVTSILSFLNWKLALLSLAFAPCTILQSTQELRKHYFQTERLQETNGAWMSLYFTGTLGMVLWFGGWEVMHSHLTAGGLTQFVLYMNQLAFPIRQLARVIDSLSRAISSGQRLFEVLDAQSPVAEKPQAKELGRAQGHVRFEHVSFSYNARIPALQQVTIDAAPGQITAILGAPGSGKSTIVHLLPRFYDVTSGHITIDD